MQAVLRIIGERGVTALSTNALADEVGVTSGALFRHFPSLDAILEGAVTYAVARLDETFPDADLPPLERLTQMARNRVNLLGDNPGLAWLLRSEQAYLTLPAGSLAQLRAVAKRSRKYLLRAISEAAKQGEIRSDIAPEELLVPIMGTIHALVGMPGVHRSRRKPDTERILQALLKMLAPLKPGQKGK